MFPINACSSMSKVSDTVDHSPVVDKKLQAFDKRHNIAELLALGHEGKADVVEVRRKDSDVIQVFEFAKARDMMTLATIIQNDGDHLVGWRAIQTHKANIETAAAMQIEEIEKKEDAMREKAGAFAKGFNPPEEETKSVSSTNQVDPEKEKTEKGQYKSIDANNNDDDSGILAVWKPKRDNLKKQVKRVAPKNGVEYLVSYAWPHLVEPYIYYFILINFPRELWFLRPDFFLCLFASRADDMGYSQPFWQTTFVENSLRKQSYGPNEYKRKTKTTGNSAGRTINKICFTLRIKKAQAPDFPKILMSVQKDIESLFHPAAQPGVSALTFMKENTPGIVDHFNKTHPTDDKLEQYLHDTFSDIYGRTRNTIHGVHLDRFYMDHQIKEMLQSTGVNSWEEVGDKMNHVYKNWPNKSVSEWEDIEHKSYDDM